VELCDKYDNETKGIDFRKDWYENRFTLNATFDIKTMKIEIRFECNDEKSLL
jgi:hypothetical protein